MALAEQKAMAEAKLAGQLYAPTHMVWRNNDEGQRVQVETPKRLRAGWFIDTGGQTFFALRYAGKPIEFANDKNAIAVGELSALPAILDTLGAAVRAGELDAQLAGAVAERSHMLRKAGRAIQDKGPAPPQTRAKHLENRAEFLPCPLILL